jgi:hypothetical protein
MIGYNVSPLKRGVINKDLMSLAPKPNP